MTMTDFLSWVPGLKTAIEKLEKTADQVQTELTATKETLAKAEANYMVVMEAAKVQAETIKSLQVDVDGKKAEIAKLQTDLTAKEASVTTRANNKALETLQKVGLPEPITEEKVDGSGSLLEQYAAVKDNPVARAEFLRKHEVALQSLIRANR